MMSTEDTPFVKASSGDKEGLISQLENGLDINSVDDNGNSLLHWASYKKHASIVELLLEKGMCIAFVII